ncbi:hypothetical protein [Pontibacter sp. H249]|uniref:hypothetical protein n=1 Tax=Pontibacter sp. H249 TaxID=3133420 RepID=UPI0030BBB6C7
MKTTNLSSVKYLIALCIFACSFGAYAQTPSKSDIKVYTRSESQNPLVILNGKETAMGAFVLEPDKIKSIDILKDQKATAKYGDKAKEGAVIITLKEQVELSRLAVLYAHFEVPAAQQQLKVAIDGKMVQKPELLLVELASVKKVEVATADNPFVEGGEEKYLNLVTK